jgi:hypothetical protein
VEVGHELSTATDTLVATTEQVVDDVTDGVAGVLADVGAGQLAATVEPVVDATTELMTDEIVEPVAADAGAVVVDSTSLVASTADGVLALIDPH